MVNDLEEKNIYIVCMLIRCLIIIKIVWMLYYLFIAIKMIFEKHECHFKILYRPESIRLENVQESASLTRYNGVSSSATVT